MDNVSKSQQEGIFRSFATSSTSFSDQFNVQFSESLFKYKRARPTSDSFDSSSFEFDESAFNSSFSTGEEGPEYISNGQAKVWKTEVGKQLQQALKIAVLLNAKNEEAQLHKKIGVFRNFIQLEYFEALKLYLETTVDLIRKEITEAVNESSLLNCIGDPKSFLSNRLFSPLFTNLASVLDSSLFKLLKALPKSKRIAKAMTTVRKENFIREAIVIYEVNRQIVTNRISGKIVNVRRKDRLLLTIDKEATLLRFVNQYVALGFPPRLSMLKEKAVLLLRE